MKNINFRDRKTLGIILSIVVICVFSLTIVYAALNAVLTITGKAEVSSASWNIHFANPKVKAGSATSDVPTIQSGNTVNFSTRLKKPGQYFEFSIDVVNDGNIDAMIEDFIKTPELTAEQAKYLNYEITYQNGESISSNQLLAKGTTMPIKVRIEYRKDISASSLPSNPTSLTMSITLQYIQSDGSGSSVTDNGYDNSISTSAFRVVSGDIYTAGSEICLNEECFYVINNTGGKVNLLSKYNLYVGNKVDANHNISPIENPTGIQSSLALGITFDSNFNQYNPPWYGVLSFADSMYWENSLDKSNMYVYVYNSSSNFYQYVENYKNYLLTFTNDILSARLISGEELEVIDVPSNESWLYATSFYSGSVIGSTGRNVYVFAGIGWANGGDVGSMAGIRPVIEVPVSAFN